MMREYRYKLVNVFTQVQFQGNQLAVFPDAEGLDKETMQAIAREFNFPETSFVFPTTIPGCVANVRIFTPFKEMCFAGHPTLGTSYVLLSEGRIPASQTEFVLQEKVGPVPVRFTQEDGSLFWLCTPEIQWRQQYDPTVCAHSLGLDLKDLLDFAPQLLSAGNPTLLIPLRTPEAVDRALLQSTNLFKTEGEDPFCVFIFALTETGVYARMFAPDYGISEDPATGSSTGPLAAYLMKHELISGQPGTRFVSEQGTKMQRQSFLHVRIQDADKIEVGGYVTPVGEGKIQIGNF